MPPEDEARIRTLIKLIADEEDVEQIKVLAVELEQLLTIGPTSPPSTNEKPRRLSGI